MHDPSLSPLRFLCFGVGAIGTYIGGSLALAGYPVTFIERPDVAEAVRKRGLSVEVGGETRRIADPIIVDSAALALETGSFDAAILAVKAFDTQSVLDNLATCLAKVPPVLSFQNGVENEPLLASVLGSERVIPGTVTTAVGRRGPGEIVIERLRGTGVSTLHPLGHSLVEAMNLAGLRTRAYPNPAAMKWSKMLTNLMANASSAILDMTPAQIFAHPGLYQMEIRQLRETLRVMKAQNIPVVDLPSTPVRLLAWAVSALPLAVSRPLLNRSVGAGRGAKMPSFHIDLHGGRGRSEVDYLNGAVVRYGRKFHTATPVNQSLNEILLGLTSGQIPLDTYARQPEKLLAQVPPE
jgi:2-dehydropantoate 2-reductase